MASFHAMYRIQTGRRVVPLLLAMLAVLAVFSLSLAHAVGASGPAFGIRPTAGTDVHLRFTLEPGQSQSAEVTILNNSTVPGSALSYIADTQTLVGGGFGVASASDPHTGATLWVDFPNEVTLLEPGATQVRTVNVTVPENTPPGDYIVGMAVQEAPDTATTNPSGDVGIMITTVNRQAMAIQINVPGERTPSLAIGEVSMEDGGKSSIIAVALLNDGNTNLTPSGTVQVSTLDGKVLADIDVEFGRFYAGTTSAISLPVEGFLPVGTYVISTEVWDETANVHASAIEQRLIVNPRELPTGEQAASLDAGGPVIKAPTSGTTTGAQANTGSGMSLMMVLWMGVGIGIGAAAVGMVSVLRSRRRQTTHAH